MDRKKKSGNNADILRVLSDDPVIIPHDGHDEETSLPSQNSPWPGLIFFTSLIIAIAALWKYAPAWLAQVFHL